MKLSVALGMFFAAIGLIGLGLYLAPSDAYPIQRAFREHGKPMTARVEEKHMETRSYEAGGRRRGTNSYQERVIAVRLPDRRQLEIDRLVLTSDYDRLQPGDEVTLSVLSGDAAIELLPHGPYYLLASSVDATSTQLLGWAFNGRPASGKAIAAGIPGVILLLLGVGLGYDAIRGPQRPRAGAPA
jgi:hypothetical protein